MNQLQINEVMQRIEGSFGVAMPFSDRLLSEVDRDTLQRIFGDEGYSVYLQDQVNRQIIRDYLLNAVILGVISPERLDELASQVATSEGRSQLSLHMLMNSVEAANDLPGESEADALEPLEAGPGAPPHMVLVTK